jgi:hypothetical protein
VWLSRLLLAVIPAAHFPSAAAQNPTQPDASVAIRSVFLEQLITDSRTEEQPVAKTLLRSDVTGCQTTITDSRLRIIPDSRPLQFEIHTSGRVRSQTTGVNPDAIVESLGSHQFQIIKPFWFDGRQLRTQRSHGTIQAFQTPQKVISTAGARMPMFAPLTDQIAWNRVRRMQPQINQIVAEDLSRDVLPKVDRTVEQEFIRIDRGWQQAQQTLRQLFPEPRLNLSAAALEQTVLLTAATTLSADSRPDQTEVQPGEDVVLCFSADALSRLAGSSLPAGIRLADTQLRKISQLLPNLLSGQATALAELAAVAAESSSPTVFAVEFPEGDACQIRCVDGDLLLRFRFRIHPVIGAPSGWMATEIALRGKRLTTDTWTLAVRRIDVQPDETADPSAATAVAGTAWPALIRSQLETLLQGTEPPQLPAEFPLTIGRLPEIRLRLHYADARHGQLRIALKASRIPNTPSPLAGSPQDPSRSVRGQNR